MCEEKRAAAARSSPSPRRLQSPRPGAVSSVGRAPARQAGGHWFEPSTAHLDVRSLREMHGSLRTADSSRVFESERVVASVRPASNRPGMRVYCPKPTGWGRNHPRRDRSLVIQCLGGAAVGCSVHEHPWGAQALAQRDGRCARPQVRLSGAGSCLPVSLVANAPRHLGVVEVG
jgi:hypothetical protein